MTNDETDAIAERTKRARALLEEYARKQPIKPIPDDFVDPCPEMGQAEDMVYDMRAWRKGREPLRISISNASWEILFKVAEGEDLATFVGHLVDYLVLDARTLLGRERIEAVRTQSRTKPPQET